MTYELALQLKEAGFLPPEEPTTGNYSTWMLQKTFGVAYSMDGNYEVRLTPGYTYDRDWVYEPTLSELISACLSDKAYEKSFELRRYVDEEKLFRWAATGGWGHSFIVKGPTPEEAVAKLWLELNKK